ncbi:hypothetical protein HU200_008314 [Digitaria exilis]|uniref:Sulfotransferase n=1 Tax=Digitaria exilis TaxID=1010633 RepID=A0A835FLM1_9POAL|nr:hypothetical protein HU200_008314 [Digitaria exilis]
MAAIPSAEIQGSTQEQPQSEEAKCGATPEEGEGDAFLSAAPALVLHRGFWFDTELRLPVRLHTCAVSPRTCSCPRGIYFTNKLHDKLKVEVGPRFRLFCDGVSVYGPIWNHYLEYWNESKVIKPGQGPLLEVRGDDGGSCETSEAAG